MNNPLDSNGHAERVPKILSCNMDRFEGGTSPYLLEVDGNVDNLVHSAADTFQDSLNVVVAEPRLGGDGAFPEVCVRSAYLKKTAFLRDILVGMSDGASPAWMSRSESGPPKKYMAPHTPMPLLGAGPLGSNFILIFSRTGKNLLSFW